MPDLESALSAYPTLCMAMVLSYYLAGSSSSWELRAGRTGPKAIVLPRLQTALETVRKRVHVSQSYNIGLSLSVRSEKRMIEVSTYKGTYDMGDRLRHGIQLSLVPRA